MKRAAIILIPLILVSSLYAQESESPSEESIYTTSRELESRVFQIRNRDPRAIAQSINLLGSGFRGAAISVNSELQTITARDFPENLATIDAAIKRLDVPSRPAPEIEFHLYVLVGSTSPVNGGEVPSVLEDVVSELGNTLRYSHYGMMTSAMHRTRPGNGIEGSGVAQNELVGFDGPAGKPLIFSYSLRRISLRSDGNRDSIDVQNFSFSMRMPIVEENRTRYVDVGFETPVTIREDETVVVGTTTMGDKALVIVVTTETTHPGE